VWEGRKQKVIACIACSVRCGEGFSLAVLVVCRMGKGLRLVQLAGLGVGLGLGLGVGWAWVGRGLGVGWVVGLGWVGLGVGLARFEYCCCCCCCCC
jgi:hypothetical protein